MKKLKSFILIIIILLLAILVTYIVSIVISKSYTIKKGAKYNGNLKVDGGEIKNKYGKTIQLKGVSSHGIQWDYDNVINFNNLKILKDEWKIDVFRIAVYTNENGYIENKEKIKNKVMNIIDYCIELDLYVVVDWHILSDNNPNIYKEESINFFNEISLLYKDKPNLIYEICNEPNGEVSWKKDVVPYANDVITTIRNNSPKSLIIVGTTNWSRDIIEASHNQLQYENILYAFHFYSGTHGDIYRTNIDYALKKNLPIIVSEWGTSTAEIDDKCYFEESDEWMKFLNERKISWINWSFSNTDEVTSILKPNAIELNDENLTESGKYIKMLLQE